MKNKRIFVAVFALLLVAAVSASAGGDIKQHVAKLKQELSLTDAQAAQLEQRFEALRPQGEAMEVRVKALRSDIEAQEKSSSPDARVIEQKKAQLAEAKKEWKEKVTDLYRSVLTSDQFAKWQKMEADYQHSKEKEMKESAEKKKKD